MEDKKQNKAVAPESNKAPMVRIKFKPGRAAEGVEMDENGYATVDAKTADHLVKINYAELAEER